MANQQYKKDTAAIKQAQEEMRLQVTDLELKARYWKAQHDIRFYTLAAEKIQPEYDEYLQAQQKMQQELQDQLVKMAQDQGGVVTGLPNEESHIITQDDIDMNPDLKEQGVNVGDKVGLGPEVEPTEEELKEEA